MTRLLPTLLLALALAARGGAAQAQDGVVTDGVVTGGVVTGTLKTVLDRGSILVGVRDSAAPFSFRNRGGQAVGLSVDLCHAIAQEAASALNRELVEPEQPDWTPGIKIVFVPVAADERLAKVMSGAVDLECSSTTANAERAAQVAFSPVFFLAGTKLMVPRDGGAAGYAGLAGKAVAVSAGTTNAAVLSRLAGSTTPPIVVTELPDLDAAYAQLAAGKVQAVASDDILLSGLMATKPDGSRFRLAGDFLSYEPYAVMFRRDDPMFAALIGQAFGRLASTGRLSALYNRWLTGRLPNGTTLNLPMSAHLAEMYRALGQPD